MARPLRLLGSGLLYHVMSRGNARMTIFLDDRDRHRFIRLLSTVVERYDVACHAYCLMPNHYHLLVTTRQPNLSLAIRQLNGVYSQWWNRQRERVGHVMQGRFKAQVVQHRRYLLAVSRYIHLNPVRAGLVPQPAAWAWSSYLSTAGLSEVPAFMDLGPVVSEFGTGRGALQAYARFVAREGLGPNVGAAIRADHRVIGDDDYVAQFRATAKSASDEVPLRDRCLARPSLDTILGGDPRRSALAARVREAREQHGFSIGEIAAHLELRADSIRRMLCAACGGRAEVRAKSDLET